MFQKPCVDDLQVPPLFLLPSPVGAGWCGNSVSAHSLTLTSHCNGFCLSVPMGTECIAPEGFISEHSQRVSSTATPPTCWPHHVS